MTKFHQFEEFSSRAGLMNQKLLASAWPMKKWYSRQALAQ
jgi:hypothetical protein